MEPAWKGCRIRSRSPRDDGDPAVAAGNVVKNIPIASRPTDRTQRRGRTKPRDISDDRPLDADYVIYRLEEAGATLLALPGTGWSTRLRTSSLEIVRTALEAYGWETARIRPSVPSADKIDRMDEAMAWLTEIPQDRYVLRRVVGARSLVHPITDRHLFAWRRLGFALGADHKAVQRWHAQGIALIVAALAQMD
jgi:hypothetical protein